MDRSVYIRLSGWAADALVRLAQQERRHPKDQARVLLERALARHAAREPRDGRPDTGGPHARAHP